MVVDASTQINFVLINHNKKAFIAINHCEIISTNSIKYYYEIYNIEI